MKTNNCLALIGGAASLCVAFQPTNARAQFSQKNSFNKKVCVDVNEKFTGYLTGTEHILTAPFLPNDRIGKNTYLTFYQPDRNGNCHNTIIVTNLTEARRSEIIDGS